MELADKKNKLKWLRRFIGCDFLSEHEGGLL